MSLAEQDFGKTPGDPVILGKTFVLQFAIENLQDSDVASAEWILADKSPVEGDATTLITKTTAAGVALANSGADLVMTVTVDPADQTGAGLAGGDYFHRLDYVHTNGSQYEAARGTGRLTPRI